VDDYRYVVETSNYDGNWELVDGNVDRSALPPQEYARAVVEKWICDHPRRVTGGERITVYAAEDVQPDPGLVHLRVRLAHDSDVDKALPIAVAYLEIAERDWRDDG